MRAIHAVTVILLLSATVVACGQSTAAALSGADADAIRAVSTAYTKAANSKDWAAVAGFFTDDGMFLPPNTPRRTGRSAIEAWARAFPPMQGLTIDALEWP